MSLSLGTAVTRPSLKPFWMMIPPWVILGALLVLVPLFGAITLENIHRERELTTRLLVEKGEALIRSFEAGVRAGAGLSWGNFQLQKLLIETAQQPGVDYLIITDAQGIILADSDPSLVGEVYGWDLDLSSAIRRTAVAWRQIANTRGADTFEVYRGCLNTDRLFPGDTPPAVGSRAGNCIIFVGLDMGPVLQARQQDTRNAVITALTLLLIGLAGMISLFLAQGYRSVRSSLSRVQAFSDNLVERMPIGLVAMDPEGKVIAFNKTAEIVLGVPAGGALGRKAAEVLPELLLEMPEPPGTTGTILEREVECSLPGGETVLLGMIPTQVQDDEGTFFGSAVLFRDLTEMQRLKGEVERSRRLAAIGSLASGVAHEIRNPLSSIKGFATVMRERHRDNPDDCRVTEIMIQEVERLNRVIGNLLEFSRPLVMNRKETALEPILRHTLKMIEGQARAKGVTIRTEFPDSLPPAALDSDKMIQVFLNLALNALNAMPKGGTLSVALARPDPQTLRVEVADSGTGIAEKDLSRIFDPYFTTKPSGTGLGLAIAQRIVEAHGGKIRVASEPGKGTVFSILLPRGGAPAEATNREMPS